MRFQTVLRIYTELRKEIAGIEKIREGKKIKK